MYERMQSLLTALSSGLYERQESVRLSLLAALAGESVFLLGRPGTGKSLIARRLQQAFQDAKGFVYLMGRFSTPDEVFGPISIRSLRDKDKYERVTSHYLPDADVVFLDEIWKASPPIQNALLTALNERRFRNGDEELHIPMKVFIGASNELPHPDDEGAPFWDRFLLRLVVEPVQEDQSFAALLEETTDPYADLVPPEHRITNDEYQEISKNQSRVSIGPEVLDLITAIRSSLSAADIYVSDRRWKKLAGVLRTCALLHGREHVDPIDCALIRSVAWTTLEQRETVHQIVAHELAERSGRMKQAVAIEAALSDVQVRLRSLTSARVVDDRPRPVVYRDEYFRLIPEAEKDSDLLLVWHGDIEDLSSEEREIDVFIYDAKDQLVGSERASAERSEWQVLLGGVAHTIETSFEQVELVEPRSLTDDERDQIASQIDELLERTNELLSRTLMERGSLEDEARAHLFVPVSDAEVVLESLAETATHLGRLQLRIAEFAEEAGLEPAPGSSEG